MAAFNYSRLRSTADRLITRFGQPATIERLEAPTSIACNAVESEDRLFSPQNGQAIVADRKYLVTAPASAPELKDEGQLIVGGETLEIVAATRLKPGPMILLYDVQVVALGQEIEIGKRRILPPAPGTGNARNVFVTLATVNAKVETTEGVKEANAVYVGDERITHRFLIRYTAAAFDGQAQVRDSDGELYRIIRVENINEEDRWLRLNCVRAGNESAAAAS